MINYLTLPFFVCNVTLETYVLSYVLSVGQLSELLEVISILYDPVFVASSQNQPNIGVVY